ncbi:MAG TPA: hypothetical protein PLD47_02480 [Aggregatilineales bacterium]|nr:hypothetical protein [Anaerolineales bacterium]HRE46566.1 hypothetical protein [Aggregatilineales bacterium]
MIVTFTDGTTEIYEDDPFASGGQGNLYHSRDKRSVVKLYTTPDRLKTERLKKIITEFNVTRTSPGDSALRRPDHTIKDLFAWPNGISEKPQVGVRMRNVTYGGDYKPLHWWLSPKLLQKMPDAMRGTWLDRTRVASDMARIASKLHNSGLCHSDFSSNNFLANVALQRVVLIDLDSLVVPGVLPPEILGTGDYIAPEIVAASFRGDNTAKPSIDADLHSLAVLIYQLLLMRHPLRGPKNYDLNDPSRDDALMFGERALYIEDPNDTSNRPAKDFPGAWALGDEVEGIMRKAFTIGLRTPTQRPRASEWDEALLRLFDQIIPCSHEACVGKFFVLLRDRPAVCPWCGTAVKFPQTVPVLRLYRGVGQNGHFQVDKGRIVGWQGRTLHKWHIQADMAERGILKEEDKQPFAEVTYTREHGWQLRNLNISDLRLAEKGTVQPIQVGQPISLEHGQTLLIGTGGRLAQVTMQGIR